MSFRIFENLCIPGNLTSQGYQAPSHRECYPTSAFYSLNQLLYDVHCQMVGFPGRRHFPFNSACPDIANLGATLGTAMPWYAIMAFFVDLR